VFGGCQILHVDPNTSTINGNAMVDTCIVKPKPRAITNAKFFCVNATSQFLEDFKYLQGKISLF
jgi:hypothetical protein